MRGKILLWEVIGIFFVIILGTLLHFAFDWSGRRLQLAPFVPVNESVWEHLKMGFWPMVIYALIEYTYLSDYVPNFASAKAAGLTVTLLLIMGLFYTYTGILGYHLLVLDILVFITAVVAGQLASYHVLADSVIPGWLNHLALLYIVALAFTFGILTFKPPEIPLFKDPVTGKYGIT